MPSDFTLRRLAEQQPFDTSDLDQRLSEIGKRILDIQLQAPSLKQIAPVRSSGPSTAQSLALALLASKARSGQGRSFGPGAGIGGLSFGVADPRYMNMSERVLNAVTSRFPQVSSGGIFNARNIRGTNTPSEHAYGAAVDLMVPNLAIGDEVYDWLSQHSDRFGFSNILWRQPDHYNHLHVGYLY
jgi:hypothetical protein